MGFTIRIPEQKPKLAANGSHYLLADVGVSQDAVVAGQERTVRIMVKIWCRLPKGPRRKAEYARWLEARIGGGKVSLL